jgi:hypothetical protein
MPEPLLATITDENPTIVLVWRPGSAMVEPLRSPR